MALSLDLQLYQGQSLAPLIIGPTGTIVGISPGGVGSSNGLGGNRVPMSRQAKYIITCKDHLKIKWSSLDNHSKSRLKTGTKGYHF